MTQKIDNYADFLIIGGGIVGLTIGRELLLNQPSVRVVILEKESELALHASGRNSGVIHSGFYYSPDSLKAKLTRDGNELLKEFASEKGVFFETCGKVVVAQTLDDIPLIEDLHKRGLANGVSVEIIDERQLKEIEPLAATKEIALWSPDTGVADPVELTTAVAKDFQRLGGLIVLGELASTIHENNVMCKSGRKYKFGHLINAAGLYADKVAKNLGFAEDYTLLPFLGVYQYAPKLKGALKRHIYPTPDPRNPFLGVHLTRTHNGSVKVGPSAIPVLSREHYGLFKGMDMLELSEIFYNFPKFLFSKHHDVWSLIRSELPKLSKNHLINQAMPLAPSIKPEDFTLKGKPGIRAQLFDIKERKLEMDFVLQGDLLSTHVLNAVSPAWTSSFSFAKYVVEDLRKRSVI